MGISHWGGLRLSPQGLSRNVVQSDLTPWLQEGARGTAGPFQALGPASLHLRKQIVYGWLLIPTSSQAGPSNP